MNLGPCSHNPMNNMKNVDVFFYINLSEDNKVALGCVWRKNIMTPNIIPLQLLPMGISLPHPLHEKEVVLS